MKKFLIAFFIMLYFTDWGFAQILEIESCITREYEVRDDGFFNNKTAKHYTSTIILSDGERLDCYDRYFYRSGGYSWLLTPPGVQHNDIRYAKGPFVNVDFDVLTEYPKGTLVYKYPSRDKFELVTMEKIGTYTIKKVVVRDVNVETNANLDFSYSSYRRLFRGRSSLTAHGSMEGGIKTIVNVVYTNGETSSIIAADDPIWLEAEVGQEVEHYKIRDYNIYKLIFK